MKENYAKIHNSLLDEAKNCPKIIRQAYYYNNKIPLLKNNVKSGTVPNYEVENLVMIVSKMYPQARHLTNGNPVNVFTNDEIFEQTKNALKVVREKIPNAFIFFYESTILTSEHFNELKELVDILCIVNENDEFTKFITSTADKGMGDSYLIQQCLLLIFQLDIKFKRLIKTAQRYYLGEIYDYHLYNSKPIVCKFMDNHTYYGVTAMGGIFSCDYKHRHEYLTAVTNSIMYTLVGFSLTVEHSFADTLLGPDGIDSLETSRKEVLFGPEWQGLDGSNSGNKEKLISGKNFL
jgi:hypothetical protein